MLSSYVFPVDNDTLVTYCYGNCKGYGSFHSGVDCRGALGANIYAFADGVVTAAVKNHSSYGNYIEIRHTDMFGNNEYLKTRYAHISNNSNGNPNFYVSVGDDVKKGDLIALIGSTGLSYAPHLHFETLYSSTINGTYAKRDPMIFFPNIPCDKCDLGNLSFSQENHDGMRSVGIMINDSFIEIDSLVTMTSNELERYGITKEDLFKFNKMIENEEEFSLFHEKIDSLIK